MRCDNCGWDNSANRVRCEKCNTNLSGTEKSAPVSGQEAENLKKTINGRQPSGNDYLDSPGERGEKVTTRCKTCGYPVITGVSRCPECGNVLHSDRGSDVEPGPVIWGAGQKTIDPFRRPVQPKFCLQPQSGEDEMDLKEKSYSGHEVILNRDNLEEGNITITGGRQAVITNRGGNWFIEDTSPRQTTFIQVNGSVRLQPGDVILMGNRRFIFKPCE